VLGILHALNYFCKLLYALKQCQLTVHATGRLQLVTQVC
jgi:hypothetical protein